MRLFSFADSNFTSGSLQATIGKNYAGGKNVNVSTLETGDGFGQSVALNAAGDRLAVGSPGDDGAGNSVNNSGAVRLFSFADGNFTGGSLKSTLGKGYTGGNDVDVADLEVGDGLGQSVALNATGNGLATGAVLDDGANNAMVNSGAVRLYRFIDNNFTAASLQAMIGKGYTGGNNIDMTGLRASDYFGQSVAFNAAGDRLAVGSPGDDGEGNLVVNSGAVHLFTFVDGSFAGGMLQSTIGKGYLGSNNVDVAMLDIGDNFGQSVAFNGLGDSLAVGAKFDDAFNNQHFQSGAVHLFKLNLGTVAEGSNFSNSADQSITILNTELESILGAGTNVVLQANNDITVASAVAVNNPGGNGGDLTMQAGRNINFNANITTDNGNFTAVAGDPGAIASERDPGTATVTIADGVVLDVGTGQATLAAVGGNFVNNSGSSAPILANRWSVYSSDPALNSLGGMTATGKHYNQAYLAGSAPAYATSGNWLFYSVAPVLSVTPGQQAVSYGNSPGPFSATYSGFIDGDNTATAGISGTATFAGAGTNPGTYDIDYVNGLLSTLGYMFANNAGSQGELVVLAQPVIPDPVVPDPVVPDILVPDVKTDVFTVVQKPPADAGDNRTKSLSGGCGGEMLIATSSGSVFERFIRSEDEACDLDLLSDEDADAEGKCRDRKSGQPAKNKGQVEKI